MNHMGLKIDAISSNGVKSLESPKVVMIEESDGDDDDDSQALLPADAEDDGGKSKKSDKSKRKVQWLDSSGDKLAEIMEFQPSDVSESEEDDSDSCIYRIM